MKSNFKFHASLPLLFVLILFLIMNILRKFLSFAAINRQIDSYSKSQRFQGIILMAKERQLSFSLEPEFYSLEKESVSALRHKFFCLTRSYWRGRAIL